MASLATQIMPAYNLVWRILSLINCVAEIVPTQIIWNNLVTCSCKSNNLSDLSLNIQLLCVNDKISLRFKDDFRDVHNVNVTLRG